MVDPVALLLFPIWYGEVKGSAFPLFRFYPDAASVPFDNPFTDCQPYAGARILGAVDNNPSALSPLGNVELKDLVTERA